MMKKVAIAFLITTRTVLAQGEGEVTEPAGEIPESSEEDIAKEVTKGLRVEDVVEPTADFHFAQFGKSDPFIPPLTLSPQKRAEVIQASGIEIPIVSPLQRFDIPELTLIGVWQLSSGERKGMIMTPQGGGDGGLGIIVRVGDPIGKRGGKIIAIANDYLTVREFSLALDGTRQYEDQQMYMGRWSSGLEVNGKIKFNPGQKDVEVVVKDEPGDELKFEDPPAKAGHGLPQPEAQPVAGGELEQPKAEVGGALDQDKPAAGGPPANPPANNGAAPVVEKKP